jgi:hypothetical protein
MITQNSMVHERLESVARKAGQATMDAYFNTFSDNSQMID